MRSGLPGVWLLLFLVLLLSALPAAARKTGNTFTLATSCSGCHTSGAEPGISVTRLTDEPLVQGDTVVFHVELTSNQNGGEGRLAAFSASVRSGTGTFLEDDGTEVCPLPGNLICPGGGTGNAIRDVGERAFSDGSYGWDITLSDLAPGTHTLSVGGIDANGGGTDSGDNNVQGSLQFTVAEGEGEGEPFEGEGEGEGEPPQGCNANSTSRGLPVEGSLLVLAVALCRRRR